MKDKSLEPIDTPSHEMMGAPSNTQYVKNSIFNVMPIYVLNLGLDHEKQSSALITLQAFPGSGKTSAVHWLLSQYQALGSAVFFWSFRNTSWQDFGLALANFLQIKSSNHPVSSVDFWEGLIHGCWQASKNMVLAFDDINCLIQPDQINFLLSLIQTQSSNSVLIMSSNRDYDWIPIRTYMDHDCIQINNQHLALNASEIAKLALNHGKTLSLVECNDILKKTEGWVTGVCFELAEQVSHQGHTVEHLYDAYFSFHIHQVFAKTAMGVLNQLAALEVFCLDLVRSVLSEEGEKVFLKLLNNSFFVKSLNTACTWFQLSEPLRNHLMKSLKPKQKNAQMHFSASIWFANHGRTVNALRQADMAKDEEMLANLMEASGYALFNQGYMADLLFWRKQVPDQWAQRFPILFLIDLYVKTITANKEKTNQLFYEALSRWSSGNADGHIGHDQMICLVIKSVACMQKDELETCIQIAKELEPRLGCQNPYLDVFILTIAAWASAMMAQPKLTVFFLGLANQRVFSLQGFLIQMILVCTEVIMAIENTHLRFAKYLNQQIHLKYERPETLESKTHCLPNICHVMVEYFQGNFEDVESKLKLMVTQMDFKTPIDLQAYVYLFLTSYYRLHKQDKDAQINLGHLYALAYKHDSGRFIAMAVSEEMSLILQDARADKIKRMEQRLRAFDWTHLAEKYQHIPFNPVDIHHGLIRIRLLQAQGNHSQALHEIHQLYEFLPEDWYGPLKFRLQLLLAVAYQRLGYQDKAYGIVVNQLMIAERENLIAIFWEEGEPVQDLLEHVMSLERHPALQYFIRRILASTPFMKSQKEEIEVEPLTERELQILSMISKGRSNQEISDVLMLALGTVKWHLHNIYEKLHVKNRAQAIKSARDKQMIG